MQKRAFCHTLMLYCDAEYAAAHYPEIENMYDYVLYFDIASAAIMIVLLGIYFTGKRMDTFRSRMYLLMVVTNMFTSFFNFTNVTLTRTELINREILSYISRTSYFIFHLSTVVAFYYFCLFASGIMRRQSVPMRLVSLIPFGIASITALLNPLHNLLFTIDKYEGYQRGILIWVFYACAMIYFLGSVVLIAVSGKKISTAHKISCYVFLMISVMSIVIQYFFPYMLVEAFGCSLSILICYSVIEHPEEYVDSEYNVLNEKGFERIIYHHFTFKTDFSLFCFKLQGLSGMKKALGKEYTDELIRTVIAYFDREFPSESFFRYSYSTFILIIKKQSEDDFHTTAARLREKLSSIWTIDSNHMKLRASFGCIRCPQEISQYDNLRDFIAEVMNHKGSDSMTIDASCFDKGKTDRMRRLREIVSEAIENDGFEVYYQPIISMKDKRIKFAEALVRLKNDELGYVSPEEFIPIAESQGNIVRLGEFVFRSVCRFIREHSLSSMGIRFIEINLSTVQLLQSDLSENLTKIMSSYDINPSSINLEITESAEAIFNSTFMENISSLSALGVTFALDDYGTGYANMEYFFHLPLNIIKIDKKILWGSSENKRAMAVLECAVVLAHRLGIEVVTEGVRTKEQIELLKELGCEYIQGFYYSEPLPEEEFLKKAGELSSVAL